MKTSTIKLANKYARKISTKNITQFIGNAKRSHKSLQHSAYSSLHPILLPALLTKILLAPFQITSYLKASNITLEDEIEILNIR